MLPTFGQKPMLSTNPLSFAFPTEQEPPFLLDMATSVVPFNRIKMRQELGQSIPLGWGLDAQGQPAGFSSEAGLTYTYMTDEMEQPVEVERTHVIVEKRWGSKE